MKEDEIELETLKKQVQIFVERKIAIHIDLKNGRFYNGNINEVSADFFMLEDFKIGLTPIFYLQIKGVEAYVVKREIQNE